MGKHKLCHIIFDVVVSMITTISALITNLVSQHDLELWVFERIGYEIPSIYVRGFFLLLFMGWWIYFGISKAVELREYLSQRCRLAFTSNPYSQEITIQDIRGIQRDDPVNFSTGAAPAVHMGMEDWGITPTTYKLAFMLIDIVNNPKVNTADGVAKTTRAILTFYDVKHNPIEEKARWSLFDHNQWLIGKDHNDVLERDLHCQQKETIIVCYKVVGGNSYRLNRLSYQADKLTNKACMLGLINYDVQVKLIADNAEKIEQWYKFNIQEFLMKPSEIPYWYKELYDC